jgi:hypothetical protein
MSNEGNAIFRIDGNSGNRTVTFVSDEFFYLAEAVSASLLDEVKVLTNLNISFVVIPEGFRDEAIINFIHGNVQQGWQDGHNRYNVRLEPGATKSLKISDLFDNESRYMVTKQLIIEVPPHSCMDSLDLEVGMSGNSENPRGIRDVNI